MLKTNLSLLVITCSLIAENYSIHFDYMSGYAISHEASDEIFEEMISENNYDFTVEAWYKNDDVDGGSNEGIDDGANIITNYKRSGGGDPYNNFTLSMEPWEGEYLGTFAYQGAKSHDALDDGEWHHIVGITEKVQGEGWAKLKLFIDGQFISEYTVTDEYDFISSYNNLYINNHSPFAGDHMLDCSVAGIRITKGVRYTENFTPQFPLETEDETLFNLDFSLGDGSDLNDMSPNENNFSLLGGYNWSSDVPELPMQERSNFSLSFDGNDDYVELNNRPISGNVNEFTIMTSFKTKRLYGDAQAIYMKGGNYKELELSLNSDYHDSENPNEEYTLGFHISVSQGAQGHAFVPGGLIKENTWHNAAVVWDGEYVNIYVDGSLGTTIEYNVGQGYDWDAATDGPWLGIAEGSREFEGKIDEMSFWTRALTYEEIQNHMIQSLSGNEDDLSTYWNFDNIDSEILSDLTDNGNDGTIIAAKVSRDVPVTVVFQFDLNDQVVSESGPHIAGSWNDWCSHCDLMTDTDGDGVYSYVGIFTAGDSIQYKFINGNSWTDGNHDMNIGAPCGNGNNREYIVPNESLVLDPVCMSSCEPCNIEEDNFSLSFDGDDDYVSTGIPYTELYEAEEVSISASFKWFSEDNDGGPSEQGILANSESGNGQIELTVDNSWPNNDKKLCLVWADRSTNDNAGMQHSILDYTIINFDEWYNVRVVLSDNHVYWYLDDILVETDNVLFTELGRESSEVPDLNIGRSNRLYDTYFHGLIDEVKISVNGSQESLAQWNFNEGEGSTLTDLSGNENNGTIYGATWNTDVPDLESNTELEWSVQISAEHGNLNDVDNYLGVALDASEDFDANFDELEPPTSPGNSVQIYFPHPEWNNLLGDNFSSDIRPEEDLTDHMQVWNMELTSTDEGEVALSFFMTDVPDVPVVLENMSTNIRTHLIDGDTYSFTVSSGETYSFKISVGDTTAPQFSDSDLPTGAAILLSGNEYEIHWTAEDGYDYDSSFVYSSLDHGQSFDLVASLGQESEYAWTVPYLDLDEDNLNFDSMVKVEVSDYAGNRSSVMSLRDFAIAGDSLSKNVGSGWTLWGSPVIPENDSMDLSLGDDFDGYWATFDYVDGGYTYDGYLYQGEGYWLASMEGTEIDVVGYVSDMDVTVSLDQGWELITNPLVLDVAVDSLRFFNGIETKYYEEAVSSGWVNALYSSDGGGYSEASSLHRWNGYWLAVLEDDLTMTFPIHLPPENEPEHSREDYWAINFNAQIEGANDNMLIIGYHENATDGFDQDYDSFTPPSSPAPDHVTLSIPHPEWDMMLGNDFSSDIRSMVPANGFKQWSIEVESSSEDISLTWNMINVPEQYEVGYSTNGGVDFGDLRQVEQLTISSGQTIEVRIGSQVLSLDGPIIPTEFVLQQNYPNPFNPMTQIYYGIPKVSMVKITIYDVMGRVVKDLVNGQKDVGYHSVNWNAENDMGDPVSAGMYFYTIHAGEFFETKKMVLLK